MAGTASRRTRNKQPTGAERVTLVVSIVLLALLVGGLITLELRRGDAHARVDVTPHFADAYRHDDQWYLPVTIRNDGDRATGTLRVDVVRPVEGEQPEVAELEYAFVAGDEEVEGTAVFDEEPTADTIELDVVSVTEP